MDAFEGAQPRNVPMRVLKDRERRQMTDDYGNDDRNTYPEKVAYQPIAYSAFGPQ